MPIIANDEFTVNTSGDAGSSVTVAGDAHGAFLVSWVTLTEPLDEFGESRNSYDILARAFSGANPLGGDVIVNTERHDGQFSPQATTRSDGSYLVVYSSGEENHLPGTYVASQVLDADGERIGGEQLGDYSYYHRHPDVAVDHNDFAVIVWGEETRGGTQVRGPDNSLTTGEEAFGFNGSTPDVAVALVGTDRLLFWTGYKSEAAADNGGAYGLWAVQRTATGRDVTTFLVAAGNVADPTARTLGADKVVVTWSADSHVFAAITSADGTMIVAPFAVAGGSQSGSEVAVLDNGDFVIAWQDNSGADGSGSGIEARVFHADGTPVGDAFVVDQRTAGDQLAPSVAAIGDGRFVVAWQGTDGVEARIFTDAPSNPTPTSPLFTRAGTIDLSRSDDQVAASSAGANSVFVDLAAASGADRVTNFGKSDILLTTAALYDGNRDGIVGAGKNGVFHLDAPKESSDALRLDGVRALRFLGTSDGLSVYADAAVRPSGAIEGGLATETLHGKTAGTRTEVFFRDTALGISLGDDTIAFGATDLLVTTTRLADGNRDGMIGFGANGRLDSGLDHLTFQSESGHGSPKGLEFDGMVTHGGVDYFVYSAIGSAAGTAQLHFG